MNAMNAVARASLVSVLVLLGACATAPRPLQGEYTAILPSQAAATGTTGTRVRWGGQVVAVHNGASESCFEIVGKMLGVDGRPVMRDRSEGRFIACRGGFYDPAVFTAGREVTVAGTISSFETRRIDAYDYRYPRVAADVVYLWPERRDREYVVERPWFIW
jgi:outer membrane lipoprotein